MSGLHVRNMSYLRHLRNVINKVIYGMLSAYAMLSTR